MKAILDSVSLRLDLFMLMFVRVSALIVSSPIFGRRGMPNILKICFCLAVSYVLFAANLDAAVPRYSGFIEFGMLVVLELIFGLVLGFVTTLFFSLVQLSGHYIDMQMGFGMVNVLDMQNNVSVPITGNLLNLVLLIAFFGVNGHLRLVHIIGNTFSVIPPGNVTLDPQIGMMALDVFILSFLLSVHVALPLVASGLLVEVVMGFIIRAVPQINIFVVGIPIKILVGIAVLLIVMPIYVHFTDVIFDRTFESIDRMILGLMP
ncbi:MAG: flagellar biosynthetic protein FliR [Christensenellales bacterium]|jgi:flagellar biosynthetic protein FliR